MWRTTLSVLLSLLALTVVSGRMLRLYERCEPRSREECGHGMICERNRCQKSDMCFAKKERVLADIRSGRLQDADPGAIQCDNDEGNYLPRQCARTPFFPQTNCVCVDKYTGLALQGYHISFEPRQDPDKNMTCECAQRRALYVRQGDDFPDCEEKTGNFKSMRCGDKACACVDFKGKPLTEYKSFRNGESSCQCARDLYAYSLLQILGLKFNCDEFGRYSPVQCRGTLCYCADENGQQRYDRPTAPIHLINTLRC